MGRAIKLMFQRRVGGRWAVGWFLIGRRTPCLKLMKGEMMNVGLIFWHTEDDREMWWQVGTVGDER